MEQQNSILGLHILQTLQSNNENKLLNYNSCAQYIDDLLLEFQLEKVGASFFIFENKSFTTAICLKESHICIHTWPEINRITMDVYLCNYSCDNTHKVKAIAHKMATFFEASIVSSNEIVR
ncbi:S-adenosylmethionine decarboxylase family protein [Flavobacterium sp. J27]|uniref:S-adenosylmethionine decarboxylase family protein n=1 Tax=Flavobacterium sp. J27 TaxID=2060419 RepID=UPI001031F4CC|nr:S-adenosylmethionine decarboxylase [Flavobacterium sp. J27]